MLTGIEVENFKGIGRSVRIELRPITLLFGPNSAGKSTILHALHYAREILERQNPNADRTLMGGELLDLGGFARLVHGRDLSRVVRIRIDLKNDGRGFPNSRLYGANEPGLELGIHDGVESQFETAWVELQIRWSERLDGPYVEGFTVGADGALIAKIESNPEGTQIRMTDIALLHPLVTYDGRFVRLTEDERLPVPSGAPERTSTLCETGTRSALPSWTSPIRIIRPPRQETVERLLATVVPAYYERLRQAVSELATELDDGSTAASESDESDDEEPTEADRRQKAEEFADFLDSLWNDELQTRLSVLVTGLGGLALEELRSMRYLGPLRKPPERSYSAPRSPGEDRWASGLAAWDRMQRLGSGFVGQVSEWLSSENRLGAGYGVRMRSFKELPDDSPLMLAIRQGTYLDDLEDIAGEIERLPTRHELALIDADTGLAVQSADVGVGISQVLPVVVAALDPGRPGLTAIEQPELHIHPRLQVELGDLFAEQAKGGRVFLLETHSEHLMLRLLRRIEETHSRELPENKPELRPDQVSVVFVEQLDGEVKATPLRIDETGEFIDRWPRGFFEERAEELF